MLGARPLLGRGFRPDERAPGAPHVAVLSEALWRELYDGPGGRAVVPAAARGPAGLWSWHRRPRPVAADRDQLLPIRARLAMSAPDSYLGRRQFLAGVVSVLFGTEAARTSTARRTRAAALAGEPCGHRAARWPTPAFVHPEPRAGVTAARVLRPEQLSADEEVRRAYAAARAHPGVFDGLSCACRCEQTLGHRSLLGCFETEQPVGCATCRDEAAFVAPLAAQGLSLAQIRAAVDRRYSG